MLRPAFFAIALLAAGPAVSPASAQLLPPRGIPGGDGFSQAQAPDSANLLLRIDRLENQLRSITGQLEQSQFQVRRLEDQLRKFQQDVEARFQDGGRGATGRPGATAPQPPTTPQRRGSLEPETPVIVAGQPILDPSPAPAPTGGRRRGDAFDPASDPSAPGAPRQLGTLPAEPTPPPGRTAGGLYTGPLDSENDPNAPLDLLRGTTPRTPGTLPAQQPQVAAMPPAGRPLQPDASSPAVASIAPPASPRDEFDLANASLKDGHYEVAETGFRTFLQKHPKDRLAADATFYLGESFYRRSRPREAAEQYFKVSTDFARSSRAPEALLKLGLSLEKLGAREQACAAFGEVGRKYPNAPTTLRASAERESKRVQC